MSLYDDIIDSLEDLREAMQVLNLSGGDLVQLKAAAMKAVGSGNTGLFEGAATISVLNDLIALDID